jgi:homoserine dehydrogenase
MSLHALTLPDAEPLKCGSEGVTPLAGGRPVVVLKFGSSVLRGPEDLPNAVSEIYRHVRAGERVVAVVSAFSGHTDQMLRLARSLGSDHENNQLPRYVAIGEEKSAALLAIACDRSGLASTALNVAELGIIAQGAPEDASPLRLESAGLERALDDYDVVVVPGFGARCEDGHVVLLGRGGSDLTGVFIAAELGLDRVRLIKDVDGVYEGDPAVLGDKALRYDSLDWATARKVAGKLVQPRAIDYAEDRGVAIEVAQAGRGFATRIGGEAQAPLPANHRPRRRVAVAGCGVVGGGVIERVLADPDYELVAVLVRDPSKARGVTVAANLLTNDPAVLFAAKPDVLVETLSEGAAGERLIRQALEQGVDVVSANKQALANDLPGLRAAAVAGGARLAYSAAVGGGSPMIETVRAARRAGEIVAIEAVVNGTVNFMLDRLSRGLAFDEALAAARAAGFAEEDPSSDLEGSDSVAKLRLLAYEAFDEILAAEDVTTETLHADLAASPAAWRSLRQVTRRTRDGQARVAFEAVGHLAPFNALAGERNALRVTGADGRVWSCRGRGAGRWPTAESVLADLGDLTRAAHGA